MAGLVKLGIMGRLRQHIFQRYSSDPDTPTVQEGKANAAFILEEPNQPFEDEITQSRTTIDLSEQLYIIGIVKAHLKEFVLPGVKLEREWISGHAIFNEIFVSQGEEAVYRCNVEAFYQDNTTGMRKRTYIISLVKFAEDQWRVFQVKDIIKGLVENG